jgi:hypothetical protein
MSLLLQDGTNLLLQDGTNLLLQAGAPPVFTVDPVDATIIDGQNTSFTGLATSDTPISYEWYLAPATPLGELTTTLLLTDPGIAADGNQYFLRATNDVGFTDSATATLTVNEVTFGITVQPVDTTVIEGEIATFIGQAVGEPTVTYQWYETGVGALGGETGVSLSIQTLLADQGRSFYFEATDGYGNLLTSDTGTLSVTPLEGTAPNVIKVKTPGGQWIDFLNTPLYAYGGVKLDTPTALADITASYQVMPVDAAVVTSPSFVTQDFANNGIRFSKEGVYLVSVAIVLEHAGSAAGSRTIDARLSNTTDTTVLASSPWSVGRNDEVTAITASLLFEVGTTDLGDLIQLEIGNASANITGVTARAVRIDVSSVSALG